MLDNIKIDIVVIVSIHLKRKINEKEVVKDKQTSQQSKSGFT